jgi:hypothetical protein
MRAKEIQNINLMRLSGQFLELVSVFKEASKNLKIIFLLTKTSYKFKNHLRMCRKYLLIELPYIGRPSKNYSCGNAIPLSSVMQLLSNASQFPLKHIPTLNLETEFLESVRKFTFWLT